MDSGITWRVYRIGFSPSDIVVDPTHLNVLHACGEDYDESGGFPAYARSTDGGVSWSIHPLPRDNGWRRPNVVSVDPSDLNIVYVGGACWDESGDEHECRIYKSIDDGASWSDISSGITGQGVNDIKIDPSSTERIYVLTNAGLYRSFDGGSSWSRNEGWAEGYELAIDPNNTNVLYTGSHKAVFKSTDSGANWSRHTNGVFGDSCSAIAVDNASSDNVFFTNRVGVFRSTNSGVDWTASSSGLLAANITALKVAPSSPGIMYAAFEYNAVFKTQNAIEAHSFTAMAWDRLPEFYACHNVADIEVDPADSGVVYVLEGGG